MYNQLETIIIDNTEATLLLKNLSLAEYLQPFFIEPRNLTQAALELNISRESYYYWIKKFLKLGLLVIAYEQKRSGSNIKYYITPAKIMILKLEKGLSSLKQFYEFANNDYNDLIIDAFISSIENLKKDIGISFGLNKQAKLNICPLLLNQENDSIEYAMLSAKAPAAYAVWKNMQLSFSDAKELQSKLVDIINEYEHKAVPGQANYYIQVAIVPEK